MKILEGKKVAGEMLKDLKKRIKKVENKPFLAVILIGENKASKVYVGLKKKASMEAGIGFKLFEFGGNTDQRPIIGLIGKLNNDPEIHGIIVQLPLPKDFDTQKIINAIDPSKDVDGFHPENEKLFFSKKEKYYPVFPGAIMELIRNSGIRLRDKSSLVIANSHVFGKVMSFALRREGMEANYIISKNIRNNLEKIRNADILVTAIGKAGTIKGGMIKKGAVVIDGGIVKKGKKVLGDIDFESSKKIAGFITPVPGGVGPVTIACLLKNVYWASKNK